MINENPARKITMDLKLKHTGSIYTYKREFIKVNPSQIVYQHIQHWDL